MQTMYYSRTFFETLFEAVRQEIIKLTNKKLDILNKDGRPSSAALGNNLEKREVLLQIQNRKKEKPSNLLAYEETFKAIHYINLHPEVETLASKDNRGFFDFGRRLYLKMKQLKDDPDLPGVEIKDVVEINALFRFIDCVNEDAFCKTYNVSPPSETPAERKKTGSLQKKETNKSTKFLIQAQMEPFVFQIEEGFHHFLFCYYSKRSDQINKALVSIAHDGTDGPWEAREYGFHQGGDNFASIPFRGEAKIYGRRLYINLESASYLTYQPMQMNFIGLMVETVGRQINQKPIPCSLQTSSIHAQYTISAEGYLLPCSFEQAKAIMDNPYKLTAKGIPLESEGNGFSYEELENLTLYLTMSRKHFHLELNDDGEPMTDLENLTIHKVPVSKFRDRLKGTWRLWNFGLQRSALIESKLTIGEDFQARFIPYIDPKVKNGLKGMSNQMSTLSISDEIRNEQLCVTTFSPKGDLMNMTCFDFDGHQEDGIADGIFLSIGYDRPNSNNHFKTNGPIGGYVVMRKLQSNEPDFIPKKIKPGEVEKYVKDLELEEMLQRLKRLWKRKTQKKLVNLRMGAFAVCPHSDKGLLFIENQEEFYKGIYDLPGGMLKEQGKSLDEILSATFQEQTGCDTSSLVLWQNATEVITIDHGRNITENIHLVGALYKGDSVDIAPHQKAFYLDPRGMDKEKFTPFAWLAVQDFLKNKTKI